MVMMDLPVYIRWEDRDKAEQKFGFDLYQGGVPPGKEIRVVQVDGEVQACAGTHCHSTGEVGAIKIIRVEHIQDGVETDRVRCRHRGALPDAADREAPLRGFGGPLGPAREPALRPRPGSSPSGRSGGRRSRG